MPETALAELDKETERALTDLIMNCPELTQLEALLSRFNIFRVLRAEKHEIRHSNMLAWLLTPDESHGLGDRFLRRWLMRIVHEAEDEDVNRLDLPSPIEIDSLEIETVEVAREGDNIDLLLVIRTAARTPWVVCIENKVGSTQHSDQLRRYRELVERQYADSEHRLFLLLTRDEEEPEDKRFLTSRYEVVEGVLRTCFEERKDVMGPEPRFLVAQYLELLAEDFVGESRATQLARQIYKSHRKAIEFIVKNLDDPISEASRAMEEVLTSNAPSLGIVMGVQNKGYIRFLPKEWDLLQNAGGTAWGPNSRFVACEVNFYTKKIELHITAAKTPDVWADRLWARSAEPPFKQEWKKRPLQYIKPYKARSNIAVEELRDADPLDVKDRLLEWIREELQKERFKQAVQVMKDFILELPATKS